MNMRLWWLLVVISVCSNVDAFAGIKGYWKGEVMALPVVFHVFEKEGVLSATLASPAQGAKDVPCHRIVVDGDSLKIEIPVIGASFKGVVSETGDLIRGFFTQGATFPMLLSRTTAESVELYRPQEPKPPFLYNIREVTFSHDNVTLAGTLTTPLIGSSHPAVVLVSGSGSQNRDEEIAGHKPFAVIADYLTRSGIAVLRYDDRGVGGSSKGRGNETTLDYAADAKSAIDFLKTCREIDSTRIGVLGHSEGGLIAAICAAERPRDVAFVVSLAGVFVKGRDLMVRQNQMLAALGGHPLDDAQLREVEGIFDAIDTIADEVRLRLRLDELFSGGATEEERRRSIGVMTSPWYMAMVRLDPSGYLGKIQCPVFALNGEWDVQVDAEQNLTALKKLVPSAMVKSYPRLNHLFQELKTQSQSLGYGSIPQTISPEVLTDVASWIVRTVSAR